MKQATFADRLSEAKFIRKMNVNVYTLKLGGDYFAYPKWSKGIRFRAFIEAELDILFNNLKRLARGIYEH